MDEHWGEYVAICVTWSNNKFNLIQFNLPNTTWYNISEIFVELCFLFLLLSWYKSRQLLLLAVQRHDLLLIDRSPNEFLWCLIFADENKKPHPPKFGESSAETSSISISYSSLKIVHHSHNIGNQNAEFALKKIYFNVLRNGYLSIAVVHNVLLTIPHPGKFTMMIRPCQLCSQSEVLFMRSCPNMPHFMPGVFRAFMH